eukprot:gene13594-13719_t
MGLTVSKADSAPPPMPEFIKSSPVLSKVAEDLKRQMWTEHAAFAVQNISSKCVESEEADYVDQGLRFEVTRPLNQNFFLTHSLFMGNLELPGAATGSKQMLKVPVGTYEFGANLISEKGLSNEAGQSQVMADIDVKGKDWNGQVKLGSPQFLGLNYFQSVTPSLSAGGEFFWLGGQLRSGLGLAVRHTGDKHTATMQLASTGILSAQYAHKVTDKLRHWQLCGANGCVTVLLLGQQQRGAPLQEEQWRQ